MEEVHLYTHGRRERIKCYGRSEKSKGEENKMAFGPEKAAAAVADNPGLSLEYIVRSRDELN